MSSRDLGPNVGPVTLSVLVIGDEAASPLNERAFISLWSHVIYVFKCEPSLRGTHGLLLPSDKCSNNPFALRPC